MSDFTTDTPGSNGPTPLGSEPHNGPPAAAPRFAPRPDETGTADLAGPAVPPGQHAARPATPPGPARPGPAAAPQPNVKGRIHIEDEVVEKVAALAGLASVDDAVALAAALRATVDGVQALELMTGPSLALVAGFAAVAG